MLRTLFCAIASAVVSPAIAVVIPLSISHTATSGDPSVYTVSTTFSLPVGFINPVLNIETLSIDDRGVFELNDVIVSDAGIFGPGSGSMTFTPGGTNDSWEFLHGNGTQDLDVFAPFLLGLNTIDIIVNDTSAGIGGAPLATGVFISGVGFTGTVTFDVVGAAVPVPATLTLLALGLFALGAMRPRKRS